MHRFTALSYCSFVVMLRIRYLFLFANLHERSNLQLLFQMFTLNCKGKLLLIEKPMVMGIINATPDSFYEGHIGKGLEAIWAMASGMIEAGAGILDIGGQSTRPGSQRIDEKEEMERVLPVIRKIREHNSEIALSVDTYYSTVAGKAVDAGANIVNDISNGELDSNMISTVASLQVPYIAMHMKGKPETMQQLATYDDVVKEVLDYFIEKLATCKEAGIHDIIIDPGFGFGKTAGQNLQLLRSLSVFGMFDKPVLAGLSRKSTICKTLGIVASEALNGTTVLNTIALLNGASLLRVHDVKEAKEAVDLVEAYRQA